MRKVIIKLIILGALLLTQQAMAADFRITTVGDAAHKAILQMQDQLAKTAPNTKIQFIPELAKSSELIDLIKQGAVDIVVVPFVMVPELAHSPLLEPFLSKDAAGVRQAIDSQVGANAKVDVEKVKLRALDFWHVSSTIFGSKVPIENVMALKGLKFANPTARKNKVLEALGLTQISIPAGEIVTALERGALDTSPVPLDTRAQAFGFNTVVNNYVDRLYKPNLYAVLVTTKRWEGMSYPDQYALARAAATVGDSLTTTLDAQALVFKQSELIRGAQFTKWNTEDVSRVLVASLQSTEPSGIKQGLVRLAYATAAAQPSRLPDDGIKPRPQAKVMLYFATDRIAVGNSQPETAFSSARKQAGLSFGAASVKLATNRKYGNDLEKTTKITQVTSLSKETFIQRVSADQQVVLFVHGYNNAYADAIRRGATIKADIAPNAIIISYTWPSDGTLLSYGYDEESTGIADQNFKLLMKTLTDNISSNRISIIAHSMGSRLVLNYIAGLSERAIFPDQLKFDNLVFAASDVAQTLFKQKEETPVVPKYPLSAYAKNVTVYSSQYDRPLGLSKTLHGSRPLGLADPSTMFLAPGITAVDASPIDPARWYQRFSFATRHSYVFDKAAGVRDLSLLLSGQDAGTRPGMTRKSRAGNQYWMLSP